MAITADRPITVRIGDYYSHKIILPATDEDGNAIDWDTATFAAQIRTTPAATGSPTATFTVDSTNTQDIPPYVVLTLSAVTTAAFTAGTYYWDFQETRNSQPRTPLGGVCRIEQDVTR